MESDLGSVLDWRRTTFWRDRSCIEAWKAFCRKKLLPSREEYVHLLLDKEDRCAPIARSARGILHHTCIAMHTWLHHFRFIGGTQLCMVSVCT